MEASDLAAVGFHEPPAMEVWLTRLVLGTVGRGWYRRHIDGLGLKGDERVMDFGSGAGIGAKYVAEILKDGHLTCVASQRYGWGRRGNG